MKNDKKKLMFDLFLKRIAEGEDLFVVCSSPDMPSKSTISYQAIKDPDFRSKYEKAKVVGKAKWFEGAKKEILALDQDGMPFLGICKKLKISPKFVKEALSDNYAPLPGFPKTEKFKAEDEIRDYLNGEKVQCLLCGRRYRGLFQHLLKGHGMPLEEYRVMFGIPLQYGLAGEETIRLMKENSTYRFNTDENVRVALATGILRKTSDAPPANRYIHEMPALIKKRRSVIQKAIKSENHISKRSENIVKIHCGTCGDLFGSNELAVITKGGSISCPKCKREKHKIAQAKTLSYSTPGRMKEYSRAHYQLKKGNFVPMEEYKKKYLGDIGETDGGRG